MELSLPTSEKQSTLVALCQRRDDITQMRTQEKCRLEAPENNHIKESCQKTIGFFNSQIDELNNTIQKIIDESRELQQRQKILKTVPGKVISRLSVFNARAWLLKQKRSSKSCWRIQKKVEKLLVIEE